MAEWKDDLIYLALDTSMLWDRFCHISLSIIYRGRAVPLIWKMIEHGSNTITLESYRDLLEKATKLLPSHCKVVFLAGRGFADTNLMEYLSQILHWPHYTSNSRKLGGEKVDKGFRKH